MTETYENIKKLIENTEYLLERHRDELKVWKDLFYMQGAPKSLPHASFSEYVQVSSNDTPLDRIVDNIRRYEEMIELEESSLGHLKGQLESINTTLGQLQGLEHRIAYMKLIEGLTLLETKEKLDKEGLNYSCGYLQNLYAKIKKVRKELNCEKI